jgi:hypothetical protein
MKLRPSDLKLVLIRSSGQAHNSLDPEQRVPDVSLWRRVFQMKLSIGGLVLVVAFVIGLGPLAQAQGQQQQAPQPHDMTGCLAKAGEKFQLTNLERGPATVEIAESSANLAPHVGHKITITGTRDASAPGHTMKVTAIKMVAAQCP